MKTLNRNFRYAAATFAVFVISLCLTACGGGSRSSVDSAVVTDSAASEDFHADNDIAMTIRSVADAIRVGEPLDTVEYSYECVFTDGQGSPLYTNRHGAPGKWIVDAETPTFLTIRNVDLGDLMAEDLENYIISNLGLDRNNIVESLPFNIPPGYSNNLYAFGGGLLRIEIHSTTMPDGSEAPLMVISLSKMETR